jgi:hypothetical protein
MLQFAHMFKHSRSQRITVRVIRDGLPEPPDLEWSMASPEERIEGVWMLTEICLLWNNPSTIVPRLQRTVTRLQRAER